MIGSLIAGAGASIASSLAGEGMKQLTQMLGGGDAAGAGTAGNDGSHAGHGHSHGASEGAGGMEQMLPALLKNVASMFM